MIGERPQADRGESDVRVALDERFAILGHERRRRVLFSLLDAVDGAASPSLDGVPGGGSDPAALEMRHVHLPKLDAAGYVDWDRETDDVRPGRRFDEIRPLLEVLLENRDRVSLAYA